VNALGDDDGYVEPLEQTDDFGESAYEYTYHPQDDQEQQPKSIIQKKCLNLFAIRKKVVYLQIAKIRNLPMRRKNLVIESLGLKRNSMSAMSGFKRPECRGESDKWTIQKLLAMRRMKHLMKNKQS
jgi:hypothetical protein